MKTKNTVKFWLMVGFLSLFISACATTQDEVIEQDGAPTAAELEAQALLEAQMEAEANANASGLDGSDTAGATALVDETPMSAVEMLEATEGALSNRTIYFEFDSAKLTDESLALLETHGNFIAGNGNVEVRLEGHTDERGSREYNIALGDRRAQSVRRVLLFQGSSTDQIDTVSYGEEKPFAMGHSEEAWNKNRRVELIYQVK